MTETTATPIDVPETFASAFRGSLVRPGEGDYDEARRVHNGLIDKRPGLIARCATTEDVVAAVNLARDRGVELSVRGGGHSVAGRAVTEGGLMVDLSLMRSIHVDPAAGTASAEGGVTWRELDEATHEHGLMTPGGVVSSTGIAGLTLGGGLGWTQGRFGLTIDNLLAAEVVAADGAVLTASKTEHPDLFWALRGGGGNFGVVTRFTYRTHPLETVLGGTVVYPVADALRVLETYRDVTAHAPDELSVQAALFCVPDGSGTRAAGLSVCHCGNNPTEADHAVAPLRHVTTPLRDLVARIPYPVKNSQTDVMFPRGARNYWKQAFVDRLTDDILETLVDARATCPSDMTVVVVEQVHGAATRVPVEATAFPYRKEGYAVLLCGQWLDPADDEANIAWTRTTYQRLAPHLGTRRYVNYMSADDAGPEVAQAYGPNYARLREAKRRYDPANLFRLNQNIDPS